MNGRHHRHYYIRRRTSTSTARNWRSIPPVSYSGRLYAQFLCLESACAYPESAALARLSYLVGGRPTLPILACYSQAINLVEMAMDDHYSTDNWWRIEWYPFVVKFVVWTYIFSLSSTNIVLNASKIEEHRNWNLLLIIIALLWELLNLQYPLFCNELRMQAKRRNDFTKAFLCSPWCVPLLG